MLLKCRICNEKYGCSKTSDVGTIHFQSHLCIISLFTKTNNLCFVSFCVGTCLRNYETSIENFEKNICDCLVTIEVQFNCAPTTGCEGNADSTDLNEQSPWQNVRKLPTASFSCNWWGFQARDTLQDGTDNSSIDKVETSVEWQKYFSQFQDSTDALPCHIHLPVCVWITDLHSRASKKKTSRGF